MLLTHQKSLSLMLPGLSLVFAFLTLLAPIQAEEQRGIKRFPWYPKWQKCETLSVQGLQAAAASGDDQWFRALCLKRLERLDAKAAVCIARNVATVQQYELLRGAAVTLLSRHLPPSEFAALCEALPGTFPPALVPMQTVTDPDCLAALLRVLLKKRPGFSVWCKTYEFLRAHRDRARGLEDAVFSSLRFYWKNWPVPPIHAVAALKTERAVSWLIDTARDESERPIIRIIAINYLVFFKEPRVIDALVELSRDKRCLGWPGRVTYTGIGLEAEGVLAKLRSKDPVDAARPRTL